MIKRRNKFSLWETDKVRIEIIYKGKLFYAYCDLEDWDKVKDYTWYLSKDNHGHAYYVRTTIELKKRKDGRRKQKYIYMHRLIMNTPKWMQVDHIDWDGKNNCKYNLRNVTSQENANHRRSRKEMKNEDYPLPDLPPF